MRILQKEERETERRGGRQREKYTEHSFVHGKPKEM
jgi:hypothetical protein